MYKKQMDSACVVFFLLALWFFMLTFTDRAIFVGSVAPWQAPVEVEEEE